MIFGGIGIGKTNLDKSKVEMTIISMDFGFSYF